MHLLRKYDVAPFGRNDAMFAPMCPQAHIIRVANIIGAANIICRRQTSLKKAPFVIGKRGFFHGAGGVTRTRDLLITSEMLYRLSYTSICSLAIISVFRFRVNRNLKMAEEKQNIFVISS